jgi:hypothetical protein
MKLMEGKVIHFDFNKGKRIDNDPLSSTEELRKEEEPEKEKNLVVRFAKFLISEKAKKIMNLPATRDSYAQAEIDLKKWSVREMISWLEESEEEDWQTKPSLCRAMIEALKIKARNFKKEEWELEEPLP